MTGPLPEGHTARRLADAMRAVPGIPAEMADRAATGYYHDFLSPLALPEMALASDLAALMRTVPEDQRAAIGGLRQEVIRGEHDASRAESDAWAASAEGQETMRVFGAAARRAQSGGA